MLPLPSDAVTPSDTPALEATGTPEPATDIAPTAEESPEPVESPTVSATPSPDIEAPTLPATEFAPTADMPTLDATVTASPDAVASTRMPELETPTLPCHRVRAAD